MNGGIPKTGHPMLPGDPAIQHFAIADLEPEAAHVPLRGRMGHFRQELRIWNSVVRVPLLQPALVLLGASHAIHSNLRYAKGKLRDRIGVGRVFTLEGRVPDVEGSTCGTGRFVKIGARSEIRISGLRVLDVGASPKSREPPSPVSQGCDCRARSFHHLYGRLHCPHRS